MVTERLAKNTADANWADDSNKHKAESSSASSLSLQFLQGQSQTRHWHFQKLCHNCVEPKTHLHPATKKEVKLLIVLSDYSFSIPFLMCSFKNCFLLSINAMYLNHSGCKKGDYLIHIFASVKSSSRYSSFLSQMLLQ